MHDRNLILRLKDLRGGVRDRKVVHDSFPSGSPTVPLWPPLLLVRFTSGSFMLPFLLLWFSYGRLLVLL